MVHPPWSRLPPSMTLKVGVGRSWGFCGCFSKNNSVDCGRYWRCWLHRCVRCTLNCILSFFLRVFLGSHIVLTLLLTRRFRVISIDNHHNSHPKALSRVSRIALEALPDGEDKTTTNVTSVNADLRDAESLRAVFEPYGYGGIHGVIHVAAYKAVGESSEIPLDYYSNNVAATVQLAQIMSEFGCKRLVYSSSATVYGIPPKVPIPETSPLQAESVYGRTKVFCETILQDLCKCEYSYTIPNMTLDSELI